MTHVYDGGDVDWGKTTRDYATWRPNYPAKFYTLLATLGVGLPGQHILDLGTGIGFLPLKFAEAGALVTGVDIAAGQIEEARVRSRQIGSQAQFLVAPAEETGLPDASFDVITASQSWIYFDPAKIIREVKRLLKPDGLLVKSNFYWLPQVDAIARASEELVLKHNPKWSHSNLRGDVPVMPPWAEGHFALHGMFVFDELIPFTREAWRGRFRACRPIGAALTPEQVDAFDREHDALLRSIAPEEFSVLHRIDAHVLKSQSYG